MNEKLKQVGPTCDKENSFDVSKTSTEATTAGNGHSIRNANTLKSVQPEKISQKPTNKDSPAKPLDKKKPANFSALG